MLHSTVGNATQLRVESIRLAWNLDLMVHQVHPTALESIERTPQQRCSTRSIHTRLIAVTHGEMLANRTSKLLLLQASKMYNQDTASHHPGKFATNIRSCHRPIKNSKRPASTMSSVRSYPASCGHRLHCRHRNFPPHSMDAINCSTAPL